MYTPFDPTYQRYPSQRYPIYARGGMVNCSSPQAAAAGRASARGRSRLRLRLARPLGTGCGGRQRSSGAANMLRRCAAASAKNISAIHIQSGKLLCKVAGVILKKNASIER